MTDYVFNPPLYPEDFFEEDEIYWIGGSRYHVIAVADTKFGRLAWALMDVAGKTDVQTLMPSQYPYARKET